MKVLQVVYSGLSGVGNVFFSFVQADVNHEMEHEALFAGIEELRQDYIKKSAELNLKWQFLKKKPGADFSFYRKFITHIKNTSCDVIILHGTSHILPALIGCALSKKRKKLLTIQHQAYNLTSFFGWIWLAFSLQFSNNTVFLNQASAQAARKKIRLFFNKKHISIIPNGIDLNSFKSVREPINSELIIGMQSRLIQIKDHETLLKAFALLKQQQGKFNKLLKLQLAGDGENRKYLEDLSKTLLIKDDVHFRGMLTEAELIPFMQSLDIYVHATLGETMSTSIMQAMACGKSIIASDVSGVNNMITHNQTGLLVSSKNETAIADAIYLLANNKDLAKKLAENAYQTAAEKYSNITMFEKYKKLITITSNVPQQL